MHLEKVRMLSYFVDEIVESFKIPYLIVAAVVAEDGFFQLYRTVDLLLVSTCNQSPSLLQGRSSLSK